MTWVKLKLPVRYGLFILILAPLWVVRKATDPDLLAHELVMWYNLFDKSKFVEEIISNELFIFG